MSAGNVHHTGYSQVLATQKASTNWAATGELLCPYPNHRGGRMFQTFEQLFDHGKAEHSSDFKGLDLQQARRKFQSIANDLG